MVGASPEKVKSYFDRVDKMMNHEWPPDLREHPELVKAYSEGSFPPIKETAKDKVFENVKNNVFKLNREFRRR
jgi:hypothetical protein